MPVLKNARHEKFAQAIAKGKNATDAYVEAGFKPHDGNAARLRGNERIVVRVAELQSKVAEKVVVTVESLTGELEEARSLALKEKQSSAAVAATMGKAKLFGLGTENRKISGTIQVVTITPKQLDALSDDELATLEAAYPVLQKLGLVGSAAGIAAEAGGGAEDQGGE